MLIISRKRRNGGVNGDERKPNNIVYDRPRVKPEGKMKCIARQ